MKTTCIRGHRRTPDTVKIDKHGRQWCTVCLAQDQRKRRAKRAAARVQRVDDQRTQCARGHELTEANTYRRPSGRLMCLTCEAANRAVRPPSPPPERCGNGHTLDSANLRIKANGNWACRECARNYANAANRRRNGS